MTIFVATLDTANFSFIACGSTQTKAMKAMENTLRWHCDQYDLDWASFRDDWSDAINIDTCELDEIGNRR